MEFPDCVKCVKARAEEVLRIGPTKEPRTIVGQLLPLSDYGQEGAEVRYKAWTCTNPDCGFTLRCDKGVVAEGRTRE